MGIINIQILKNPNKVFQAKDVRMHWSVAVDLAKRVDDLSYEEWCALYVNAKNPTEDQVSTACSAAHSILVRNQMIQPSVTFDRSIR